jgi:alpha-L-fucosidase
MSSDSINSPPEKAANSPLLIRHHHPDQPIKRTPLEVAVIWSVQFYFMIITYWIIGLIIGGVSHAHKLLQYPDYVYTIPFEFWFAIAIGLILVKLFHPLPAIAGLIVGEVLVQQASNFGSDPTVTWVLVGYIAWIGCIQAIYPYRGGEYFQEGKIPRLIGMLLISIFAYLPILYILIPVPASISEIMTWKGYYLLYFVINQLYLLLFLPFFWYFFDRKMSAYFPLTDAEKAQIAANNESVEEDEYAIFFPQPGELYNLNLTHHPIEDDNHTIVLLVGKVRVYFCTRCTAMVLGVFFTFITMHMLWELFNWEIPANIAIVIVAIAPIVPLTDWGLQALYIRPATTTSRLITGFILGICMEMIAQSRGYERFLFPIIIVYFTIFGILYFFRMKQKMAKDKENFLEDLRKKKERQEREKEENDTSIAIDLQQKIRLREEFRQLQFGMFVHFGLYSLGEYMEWEMNRKKHSLDGYIKRYLNRFDPDPVGIEQWVLVAKAMGARYICVTSKHHDGFCLWDTKQFHAIRPDYHIRSTPFWQKNQTDVLTVLFNAARKHGIRVALYYSVIDWSWSEKPWFKPHGFIPKDEILREQYLSYYLAQLNELKALFPDVLAFWFDGYQFRPDFPQILGQQAIYETLSSLYPDLLVVSNTGLTEKLNLTGPTDVILLENASTSNSITEKTWTAEDPEKRPGELCLTLNNHWGYNKTDKNYKNPQSIVNIIRMNNQHHSNVLLNFGPHWNGYIIEEQVEIARKIGELLKQQK